MGRGKGFKFDVLECEYGTKYPIRMDRKTGIFSIELAEDEVVSGKELPEVIKNAKEWLKTNATVEWKPMISIATDTRAYRPCEHMLDLEYERAFIGMNGAGREVLAEFKAESDDAVDGVPGERRLGPTYKFIRSCTDRTIIPYTPEKWSALRLLSAAVEQLNGRLKELLEQGRADETLTAIAKNGATLLALPAPAEGHKRLKTHSSEKKVSGMETLPKNLHDPVETWPKDLREAFVRRFDAFWSDPGSEDAFDNSDTNRVYRLGNQAEEDAFKAEAAQGCCCSHEEEWEFDVPSGKVTVCYGFNYGH